MGKELDDSSEGGAAPLDVRLLSANEVRLAAAVVAGKTNAEIANAFTLSAPSVETAVDEVCRKLGVSSRTELAVLLGALADAGRTPSSFSTADDANLPDVAMPGMGGTHDAE